MMTNVLRHGITVCAVLAALRAPGALLVYESFNYPVTSNIGDGSANGGVGFGGPWVNYLAGANSAVVSGSLGFTNQNGAYILPTAGNSLEHTGGAALYRIARPLAQTISGTGTLWVSFLFRDRSPGVNDGSIYLQLNNDNSPGEYDPAVFVGKRWNAKAFVNRPNTFTSATANILDPYVQSSTYLLIGRIVYTNNPQYGQATWWAYRSGVDNLNTNAPPAGGTSMAGSANSFVFSHLAIATYINNGTYCQGQLDEIRVGTTFFDVVGVVPVPPAQPVNISPSNGQLGVTLTPTLIASVFSDENGDAHVTSRWQVAENAAFTTPVWDNYSATALTNVTVPSGICSSNRVYFWRVAYQDSRGQWSDWSDATWFMTPTNGTMPTVFFYDPSGYSLAMLSALGCAPVPWDGSVNPNQLVCIGRDAWNVSTTLLPRLEAHVTNGGRALVFAQNDVVMTNIFKFRVGKHIARRVFPVNDAHPVVRGLDAEDLRDWTGESTLLEPYPYVMPTAPTVKFGWRWGGRGGVCSVPVEKPHRAGWRPILECEFDLAYAALMELELGSGLVVMCQLDLEDHYYQDPAARLLARQIIDYARTNAFRVKPTAKTHYVNGASTVVLITNTLGVICNSYGTALDTAAALNIVGPGASITSTDVASYLAGGGRIVFAPHSSSPGYGLNITIAVQNNYYGSLLPPTNWVEGAGVSASDVRFRTTHNTYLVSGGGNWERAADGQLARTNINNGVAIFCQINPDQFSADTATYFRFTRWRQARALAQVLANMGARFRMDRAYFAPSSTESYYHADYRADFDYGDDPYRYYRW